MEPYLFKIQNICCLHHMAIKIDVNRWIGKKEQSILFVFEQEKEGRIWAMVTSNLKLVWSNDLLAMPVIRAKVKHKYFSTKPSWKFCTAFSFKQNRGSKIVHRMLWKLEKEFMVTIYKSNEIITNWKLNISMKQWGKINLRWKVKM